MEYMYAAMLLHEAGKPIDEAGLKKVVEASGATVDDAKIKVTVAALKDVDIAKTISETSITAAPTAAAPAADASSDAPAEEKKEEKKNEDTGAKAEEAAAGLGALFG